jgi:hypothetical protein
MRDRLDTLEKTRSKRGVRLGCVGIPAAKVRHEKKVSLSSKPLPRD